MSAHLRGLNPPQARAVVKTEGPLLVLAGAGTGKTRVVTCRIAELLDRGVRAAQIVAVTFTNKAAREMRERVHGMLGKRDLEGMVISTFHSLGLRILREFGQRIGLPHDVTIADAADQTEIVADVLREGGIRRDAIHPRAAHFRISLWKNAAITPEQALDQADPGLDSALALAYARYEDELRRRQLVDFDDLIWRTLGLLETHPDVLRTLHDRWHYLMVDEYQDTNGCQYRLLGRLAAARRHLCVVGDDDQSIYGWRGAEPSRILNFTKDFPGAEVVTLDQNYRSTTSILDAANALIGRNLTRRPKQLWSAHGQGEPVRLYVAEDEKDEVDFVVSRISGLRSRENLPFEDVAILFRANSQCRPLEQALRARRIPYRVVGTRSFFDRREVRDLLSFLRVAKNPKDDGAFLRIANTPARGLGKGSLEKLAGFAAENRDPLVVTLEKRRDELPAAARAGADALLGLLAKLRETSAARGIGAALEELVEHSQYRDHVRMITEEALELSARFAVIDEFLEMARRHGESGGDPTLAGFLDALALRTDEENSKDDDDASPAVTLLTMHAAKGLEFPLVFIVGVEEGLLPHGKVVADDEDEAAGTPAVEEERRLFYVGITRAKRRLFLVHAAKRTRHGRESPRTPSRFLDEIGERIERMSAESEAPSPPEGGRAWLASIRAQLKGGGAAEP